MTSTDPRLGLVAGEASGDLLASLLLQGLKARWPGLSSAGIGGPKMQTQGFDAWWPSHKLSIFGYWDAIKNIRELLAIRRQLGDRLIAVSVLDFGARSVSSVYHYFDPDEGHRSLGVYSVVKEIELCASLGLDWYYLGLYVADCDHLNYKADYWPHQRRSKGQWHEFARPSSAR